MSATETDTTGTAGEDRLLRLLDDEGSRWRAGYQPPSLDDAVRRLALPGDEGARLDDPHEPPVAVARRAAWWRPVLVAAAVLVLVGGVGAVALRAHRDVSTVAAPGSTATSAGVVAPATPPVVSTAPTLTRPPAGFVERSLLELSDILPSGPLAAQANPLPVRYWVGPQETGPGSPPKPESLMLYVGRGPLPDLHEGRLITVRGHPAVLEPSTQRPNGACDGIAGACGGGSVTWAEDSEHWVSVVYEAARGQGVVEIPPGQGSPTEPTLGADDLVRAAQSFALGSSGWPTRTVAPQPVGPLPSSTPWGRGYLTLWTTEALPSVMVSASGDNLLFYERQQPSTTPTYCAPDVEGRVTAVTATTVTIEVGLYVDVVPTELHPCAAPLPKDRVVVVHIGEALGDRTVVDGSTGRAIPVKR